MTEETTKVVLFYWGVLTNKARGYAADLKDAQEKEVTIWLPISQIKHISYQAKDKEGVARCVVEIPLWLAEAKDL